MKKLLITFKSKLSKTSRQEQLVDFISDEKNIRKAVEGSMDRRVELIRRVELKENHV